MQHELAKYLTNERTHYCRFGRVVQYPRATLDLLQQHRQAEKHRKLTQTAGPLHV